MPRSFDAPAILEVLVRHGVIFVLIGGYAAGLQGSPYATNDIDISPAQDADNFGRLSAALLELDAMIRAENTDPLPFSHDAQSLADVAIWNLTTRFGELDISTVPSGTHGFPDLRRDALTITVRGVDVQVASLADIVRSKDAAGRTKDKLVLPVLRELVAEETKARAAGRQRRPPEPL